MAARKTVPKREATTARLEMGSDITWSQSASPKSVPRAFMKANTMPASEPTTRANAGMTSVRPMATSPMPMSATYAAIRAPSAIATTPARARRAVRDRLFDPWRSGARELTSARTCTRQSSAKPFIYFIPLRWLRPLGRALSVVG